MAMQTKHHVVILEVSENDKVSVVDTRGRLRAWDSTIVGEPDAAAAQQAVDAMARADRSTDPAVPVHDLPRIEAQLRDAETRRMVWFERALTANFEANGDGVVQRCNAKFAEALGFAGLASCGPSDGSSACPVRKSPVRRIVAAAGIRSAYSWQISIDSIVETPRLRDARPDARSWLA